jgi:hypothetical protein
MDFSQSLMRPQAQVVKKYVAQVIKGKWKNHEEIIERISQQLVTTKDIEAFNTLLKDFYETGYFQAVEHHKAVLESVGVRAEVVNSPSQPVKRIFNE